MANNNKVFDLMNNADPHIDLFEEKVYEMRETPTSTISNEEIIDIVMGLVGVGGSVKAGVNVFKLGPKGLKQAKDFIQLFAGSNKSKGKGIWNPKVVEILKKVHKETGLSITKIEDMARKRIAAKKIDGKYYHRSDKYRYEE